MSRFANLEHMSRSNLQNNEDSREYIRELIRRIQADDFSAMDDLRVAVYEQVSSITEDENRVRYPKWVIDIAFVTLFEERICRALVAKFDLARNTDPIGFIFRCVRTELFGVHRKYVKHQGAHEAIASDQLTGRSSPDAIPSDFGGLSTTERATAFSMQLERILGQECYNLFLLFHGHKLSQRAIAELLGKSRKYVRELLEENEEHWASATKDED